MISGIKQWDATITDLTPNQQIAWESEDGDYVAGVVTFAPIGTGRTRVNLKLFYDSKGAPAAEEDSLFSIGNHVEEDLQRFQKFMEERQDDDRLGRIPR